MDKVSRVLRLLPLVVSLSVLQAASQTVWQIGKFDQSPVEFLGSPKGPVTYEIGKSNWQKDWPEFQQVDEPIHILFPLDSLTGVYSLTLSFLIERPRVPNIRIDVNGHSGTFYLHPQLSYSRSDFTYAFDPHESQSKLQIDLPPSFLKTGSNTLTVTPVDEPASTAEQRGESGITYDAVRLEHDSGRKFQPSFIQAEALPTILYRQTGKGLVEVVDAYVRFSRPLKPNEVKLRIGGSTYSARLPAVAGFGEAKLPFEVPEWSGSAAAKLDVNAGGRRTFSFSLVPERKWTIFVVPHTHLDIGYSDFQGKVSEIQSRVLNQAAALIEQYPDFCFSMDGSWIMEQFLDTRSKPKQSEIIGLIHDGKMAMPVQYFN
ncbi:MAG: polysaccharide lyase family protein, partial [Bryobacteraceae bacterium]